VLRSGGTAATPGGGFRAVAVIEPQSTGIGGDCFALVQHAAKQDVSYNGSGRAPQAAEASWYLERNINALR